MYFPALGLLCVMSCNDNSSHRNDLTFRMLCRNVTSDEFLRKKLNLNCLQCTSLNLVYFKESCPYGVPCFLLMQKTSFHVAKGHVLQRESIPFALQKDVFCVAGLMLLPEPLWRYVMTIPSGTLSNDFSVKQVYRSVGYLRVVLVVRNHHYCRAVLIQFCQQAHHLGAVL